MSKSYLLMLLLLLMCFSCNKSRHRDLLSTIENLTETNLDSALILLNDIDSPEKMEQGDYAKYVLLMTKTKYKLYLDISNDTIINIASNYFIEKNNLSKVAMSYLYEGRVYLEKGEYEKATSFLKVAEKYAQKIKDHRTLGYIYSDIGFIFFSQMSFEKSIEKYILAENEFSLAGDMKNARYVQQYIGDNYVMIEPFQFDKAILSYSKAINFATQIADSITIARLYRSIAIANQKKEDWAESNKMIQKSLAYDKTNKLKYENYSLLAENYLHLNDNISTQQIIKELEAESRFKQNQFEYNYLLYELYETTKEYEKSLSCLKYCLTYSDSIYQQNLNHTIFEIQEKYNLESLENDYKEVVIQRQYLFILILVLFLISMYIYIIYKRKSYQKKKELEEALNRISALEELNSKQDEGKNEFISLLMDKLNFTKRLAQINLVTEGKEFMESYKKLFANSENDLSDWNNIYITMNSRYNGFIDKVKNTFPEFNEKELQLCCLIKLEIPNNEAAAFLGYTLSSYYVSRNRLYKKARFEKNEKFVFYLLNL